MSATSSASLPFEMPLRAVSTPPPAEIRRRYLKHESAVVAMGQLCYFIAMGLVLAGATGLVLKPWLRVLSWSDTLAVCGVFAMLALAYAALGRGFRTFALWARYLAGALGLLCLASLKVNPVVQGHAATVMSLIGLFAQPIGIVLTLYAAFLALSPKGAVVFSRPYREVIAATPAIQYTLSKPVVLAGMVLIAVQCFMLLAVFSGRLR